MHLQTVLPYPLVQQYDSRQQSTPMTVLNSSCLGLRSSNPYTGESMHSPTPAKKNHVTSLIRGHLELILLSILHEGPNHGVAIRDRADRLSNSYFDLQAGSTYPALHRLEKAGFIQGEWQKKPFRDKIKIYTLTIAGEKEFQVRRRAFTLFSEHVKNLWDER
jgi:PadR family transcriptional regulator PadR